MHSHTHSHLISLDVSGGVNVAGTITAGTTPFKVYLLTGTLPSAGNGAIIDLPTGVTSASVLSFTGQSYDGAGNGTLFTYSVSGDTTFFVGMYVKGTTNQIQINVPSTSTNAASKTYKICVIAST